MTTSDPYVLLHANQMFEEIADDVKQGVLPFMPTQLTDIHSLKDIFGYGSFNLLIDIDPNWQFGLYAMLPREKENAEYFNDVYNQLDNLIKCGRETTV